MLIVLLRTLWTVKISCNGPFAVIHVKCRPRPTDTPTLKPLPTFIFVHYINKQTHTTILYLPKYYLITSVEMHQVSSLHSKATNHTI